MNASPALLGHSDAAARTRQAPRPPAGRVIGLSGEGEPPASRACHGDPGADPRAGALLHWARRAPRPPGIISSEHGFTLPEVPSEARADSGNVIRSEHGFTLPEVPSEARADSENVIRSEHGFTLIEIMVVVVIIGLLLTVVASNVTKRLQTAEHVKAQADVKGLETAVETYRLDNGMYPTTEQGLEALLRKPTTEPIPQNWNGPYLKGQASVPKDRWGNEYLYLNPGAHNPDSYDLWTRGQDGQDGGEGPNADVGNWAPEPETQQTAAP